MALLENEEEIRQRIGACADATQIFVSHSSRDGEEAKLLADLLRRAMGARWFIFNSSDVYTLFVGEVWEDVLMHALGTADMLVLLLSDSSLTSEWVKKEFALARDKGIPIFTMLLGDLQPSAAPADFAGLETHRITEPDGLRTLIGDMRAVHRRVQDLRAPFWTKMHNWMTRHNGPILDDFIRRLGHLKMRKAFSLDRPNVSGRETWVREFTSTNAQSPADSDATRVLLLHSDTDADVAAVTAALLQKGVGGKWHVFFSSNASLYASAHCVVLLLSGDLLRSELLCATFDQARQHGLPVLPLLFGNVRVSDLPETFARLQTRRLDVAKEVAAMLYALRKLNRQIHNLSDYRYEFLDFVGGRRDHALAGQFVAAMRTLRHHSPERFGDVAGSPA